MKRALLRALAALLLAVVVFCCFVFWWSLRPFGSARGPVHFEVESTEVTTVAHDLARAGLIESPWLMEVYGRFLSLGAEVVPRSHLLSEGLSPREILQRLAEVGSRASVDVTFPEGFTHLQMAERLESSGVCSSSGLQKAVTDGDVLVSLQLNEKSAEGYLFPAKYLFKVDTDPAQIVRRLVKEARARFTKFGLRNDLPPDLVRLKFTEREIVILASIVERETALATESPQVARVFLNRLLKPEAGTNGRLQSDPTAAYGCLTVHRDAASCRGYVGRVTPRMLEDSSNPYNTYRHPGLPPGAIANPGETAIRAVLAPSEGDALYFVADGKGGHTFSETYEEHKRAVNRLKER